MNKKEKTHFVNELVDNVKAEILSHTDSMPNDWDGIELRWFVRDHFDMVVLGGFKDKRVKRYKNYENHVLVNNLL